MRCNAVALVAVLLAGCATRGDIASALRPADLLFAPEHYDASDVSVYGYMVNEAEAHGLWQSAADFQRSNVRNCISLLIPAGSEMRASIGSTSWSVAASSSVWALIPFTSGLATTPIWISSVGLCQHWHPSGLMA